MTVSSFLFLFPNSQLENEDDDDYQEIAAVVRGVPIARVRAEGKRKKKSCCCSTTTMVARERKTK